MDTPYEKFKSLPDADQYLKLGVTFEQLDAQAAKMSDNDAALALKQCKKNTISSHLCRHEKTSLKYKSTKQNEEAPIKQTESEQSSNTQIRFT